MLTSQWRDEVWAQLAQPWDLIIIGGGVSKKFEKFAPYIQLRARVVQAGLLNDAGIIGAAMSVPAIVSRPGKKGKSKSKTGGG